VIEFSLEVSHRDYGNQCLPHPLEGKGSKFVASVSRCARLTMAMPAMTTMAANHGGCN
jgi:hypothetical protein